jgi:hypothetical protein
VHFYCCVVRSLRQYNFFSPMRIGNNSAKKQLLECLQYRKKLALLLCFFFFSSRKSAIHNE